ncbi:uncharacterized protein LOC119272462 [Triticum dicoccoides]|uniref:MATH domain-containing protein n=1 Tax=Triticum turgidum subsp. durum TaxID=4567 RepID=A0A9R0Q8Z1_TRITD|nr:uncharacterized protein LOC119272462 [Triticum dicoccoides]XP_037409852.1 uncharacterized protein LOC119272462 [Triticum dicoccoides]XP_037409857.1 uncharacterized protein LOC119272462 [Triticum dicoccoides]VAH05489.1 unnamed protein product [Triticum turgidum subsp. durum]
MGNCKSSSRALLGKAHVVPDPEWRIRDFGKTHVPDFEWRIDDFSSLLKTGSKRATSGPFHCSGYNWDLQVSLMHKEAGSVTPYVALRLASSTLSLVPAHTVHAVFELSICNHSKGMYYGCKASYNFDFKNFYSKEHCLIPLKKLLKSSAFLVDDGCVFAVEILKIDVCSPEKKAVVVQKKATTVQNLFVQEKGFVKGTYTWNMNNFLELDLDHCVRSPTFEVGGHKWCISMYPRGDLYSTDCLSLYLSLDASNELHLESKKVAVMTLSILNQKNGKHLTKTSGLFICDGGWGWPNFLALKKLKKGYVVGSSCIVKADLTIVGLSNDG